MPDIAGAGEAAMGAVLPQSDSFHAAARLARLRLRRYSNRIHRRDADLRRGPGLPQPLPRPAVSTLAQRRPAWTSAGWLAPVDLPVDAIVALEHEERAGEPVRGERALCECECPQ